MFSKLRKRQLHFFGWLTLSLFIVFWWRSPATADTAKHYKDLEFAPLPEITLPNYERFQLTNGMTVYLIADHELPIIEGRVLIRTGERWDPLDQVGLAGIATTVMRSGGTANYSPDQLNQILEDKAASVEVSVGNASGSATFSGLSENTVLILDLFAEVLQRPAFDQAQIDLAKKQIQGAITRRNDEPGDIASREFSKLIYGADNPYASTIEYATLKNIQREDLIKFHQQYFHPANMILGIVGDFEPKEMRGLINEKFGNWQTTAPPLPALPTVQQVNQGGIFFVEQPQLTQSNVLLGHLGGKLDSPDYPALSVLNAVLNGFGGRLFNNIRSKEGLAYSVYGMWAANYDYPGLFVAGGQTRSESTVAFVKAINQEIERMRTQTVTAEELQQAKESSLNSFIFNFASPAQTLSRLMTYQYYGYPEDFIFQYQRAIAETTVEDVQRVAQKYLQPDKIVTLVVGNSQDIQPKLETLTKGQKVIPIDVTIPGSEE
jgi:zinc protease